MRYSACIEWLFAAEAPAFVDRIAAAKAAGLDAIEFWRWSKQDLDAVASALAEAGMPCAGILCEPIVNLTDPATHAEFLTGVRASVSAAQKLKASVIIAQSGNLLADVPRAAQHAAVVAALREAAPILAGKGVTLALEPLNDRVDHKGYYLTSTAEGLDIVDEVARPEIRLLYDIYHAAVMGEAMDVLEGRLDRIVHVHLADAPGRGEPGSGSVDYLYRLRWLREHGYEGIVGLEYRPTRSTVESLEFRDLVRE